MSRNLLGFLNWDPGLWRASVINESNINFAGCPLTKRSLIAAVLAQEAGPDARGSIKAEIGTGAYQDFQTGCFTTRTKQYITYITKMRIDAFVGDGAAIAFGLGSDAVGSGPTNGAVCIGWNLQSPVAGQCTGQLQVRTGGAWVAFGTAGAAQTPPVDYKYWALEVDVTGTRARILVESGGVWTEYKTWQTHASIAAAGIDSIPSINYGSSSSKGGLDIIHNNLIVVERDEAFDIAGTADDDIVGWKAMSRTPFADISGAWNANNPCGDKYTTVADIAHSSKIGGNTYIYSSAADDQLFAIANHDYAASGATDIQGVVICLIVDAQSTSTHKGPDKIIAGLGGTVTEYNYTRGYDAASGTGTTLTAWLPQKPDGAGGASGGAWTLTDFNNLQVGVRNTATPASQRDTYGIVVMALGAGWARQTLLVCPPSLVIPQFLTRGHAILRR